MRHRVTIQEPSVTTGAIGGQSISWANLATEPVVWAHVEPLRGQEYLTGQTLSNKVAAKITTRYRSDIDTTMRVVWGSHTYDITDVVNVKGMNESLELMCQEVT